ncbi:glycosyltransferase [bacterium]|nr:glycosyltransferase [bacterium]
MKRKLSVVIPCYNEEENLKRGVLEEVWDYLKKQKYSWEVIISDDGSSDKSLILARQFARKHPGFRVLKNKHGGKPWAVWKGIEAAQGEIVLFTDMDQSTPIYEVAKLLPWFTKGYDVVIGSRGLAREGFPWYRRLMSTIFRFLRGIFLLREIEDTQCGFKALRRKVALEIFPKLQFFQEIDKPVKGWRVSAFDVELLFIAQKRGHRIKEVKVAWKDRDVAMGKKKNFLKESKEMAKEILRVKFNDLRGKYA